MPIDRSNQDLFPDELDLLYDISLSIKIEGKGRCPEVAPHLDASNWYSQNYGLIDPCKVALTEGINKGIGQGDLNLHLISGRAEYERSSPINKYPTKPDLVIGCHGQKIGLFVLNESGCTTDTAEPNGILRFHFRLSQSHDPTLKCEVFPIQQVIEFDPNTLTTTIKKDCPSINDVLNKFGGSKKIGLGNIRKVINEYLNTFVEVEGRDTTLAFQLLRLLKCGKILQTTFNDNELALSISNTKVELAKLAAYLKHATKIERDKLNYIAKKFDKSKTFNDLLLEECNNLDLQEKSLKKDTDQFNKLPKTWLGQRLTLNVPFNNNKESKVNKRIGPEIIDINFLLLNDYAHYKDWRVKLKEYYDGLNLLPIPPKIGRAHV